MSGSAGSGTPWLAGARLGSRAGLQPRGLPIVAGRRREAGPRAPGLEACPGEPGAGAGGRARDTSPGPGGSWGLRGRPRVDCWRARPSRTGGLGARAWGVRVEGTWYRGRATGNPGSQSSDSGDLV